MRYTAEKIDPRFAKCPPLRTFNKAFELKTSARWWKNCSCANEVQTAIVMCIHPFSVIRDTTWHIAIVQIGKKKRQSPHQRRKKKITYFV